MTSDEKIAELQRQIAKSKADVDDLKAIVDEIKAAMPKPPEPVKPFVPEPFVPFDRTAGASRLPRSRAEMPEWMRDMVDHPSSSNEVMADIRSDRAPKPSPSLAGQQAGEGPVGVIGTRHSK